MMKVICIIMALVILYLLMSRSSSGYGEKYLQNQFVAQCPPGMMPASYTTACSECVPYYF